MTTTYGDDDADLSLLQERNIAVLGYDDLPRASALCLRDSGVDVRIGLARHSPHRPVAEAEGLRVVTPYEACEEADALVLVSAETAPSLDDDVVWPNLVDGDLVVLGPDPAGPAVLPPGVDVVRVAPWTDGSALREEYEQGRGVPLFAMVLSDASGQAWELALAYARALGSTRSGVLRTTADDYDRARGYVDDTVLRGAVLPAVQGGLDTLVRSGCQPEVAYLLCVRALASFASELALGSRDGDLTLDGTDDDEDGQVAKRLLAAAARVRGLLGSDRGTRAR